MLPVTETQQIIPSTSTEAVSVRDSKCFCMFSSPLIKGEEVKPKRGSGVFGLLPLLLFSHSLFLGRLGAGKTQTESSFMYLLHLLREVTVISKCMPILQKCEEYLGQASPSTVEVQSI